MNESTKVLLLKSQNDDGSIDPYEEHVTSLGFSVDLVPVIEFVFTNKKGLLEKLSNAEYYNGVIFTSKRAVEAVAGSLGNQSREELLNQWRSKKIYVVGKGTKEHVLSNLGLESSGEDTGNAEELAQYIISDKDQVENCRYLFPKGNLARSTISKILLEKGFEIDEVTCYETQPNSNLENILKNLHLPDYIVLFSPSGAGASLPILSQIFGDKFKDVKIVAIGPTTEAEILKLGFQVDHVVSKPTPVMLGDTLQL